MRSKPGDVIPAEPEPCHCQKWGDSADMMSLPSSRNNPGARPPHAHPRSRISIGTTNTPHIFRNPGPFRFSWWHADGFQHKSIVLYYRAKIWCTGDSLFQDPDRDDQKSLNASASFSFFFFFCLSGRLLLWATSTDSYPPSIQCHDMA